LAFVSPAHAETPLEPTTGFYKYNVESIEVTAVIWRSGECTHWRTAALGDLAEM
jgi:hypothetical protein